MNEKFVALDCQSAAQPITNRRYSRHSGKRSLRVFPRSVMMVDWIVKRRSMGTACDLKSNARTL